MHRTPSLPTALAFALLLAPTFARAADLYDEPFRPQVHFSPERNWMNDPNGLVYYDGEYHLFYQYNPYGDTWGHMNWAHAVSRDLLHWTSLPIAIPEGGGVMAFSGSAVVDWNNTSGFGTQGRPPLVAIYTGYKPDGWWQAQNLAYSNDRGRTWTPYKGNPVIDIGSKDFRDPKVSWYARGGFWVMAVAMAGDRQIAFYRSPDLRQWTLTGKFGPAGSTEGVWECPDLFPLVVEGTKTEKWVLIVNVGDGAAAGGSGTQYFVGDFDGKVFAADAVGGKVPTRWMDAGRDFYAAVTWSDVPRDDGRRLLLGWMNNWKYGQKVPTHPWRSAQSLVRSLSLSERDGLLVLRQTPAVEYERLRLGAYAVADASLAQGPRLIPHDPKLACEMEADFRLAGAREVGFSIGGARGCARVRYDAGSSTLSLERDVSNDPKERVFSEPGFAGVHTAHLAAPGGRLKLRIFVDRSSLEVFADDGRTVITDQYFAPPDGARIDAFSQGGAASVSLTRWELGSVWK